MPPVILFIAKAIVSVVGAATISMATATWIATLLVNGVIMFAAQKLLGKRASTDFGSDLAERTQMTRNSIAARRVVYGRCKVSGTIIYMRETGAKREYLLMVVVLASHELDAIQDLYVNEDLVPMNGDVPETGNKYDGFLRVTKHLGTAGASADSNLVSETGGEWTSSHKVSGHAYLAIQLKFDDKVFTAGVPTISVVVRGKKVLDPRDDVTRWSDNPALCVYDFVRSEYGMAATEDEFDTDSVIEAANICEEEVGLATSFTRNCDYDSGNRLIGTTTQAAAQLDGVVAGMRVSGSGIPAGAMITSVHRAGPDYFFAIDRDPTSTLTNTALAFGDVEARYAANGVVFTNTRVPDTIEAMLSAMAGQMVYAGGRWVIRAGAYRTPTVTLTEDDCRGSIQVVTKLSRRELANVVKGTYVSEADGWVATDFPAYAPSLYLTEDDDEVLARDITLPFTTSSSAAQRLAKIELERVRQQILTRWQCKLSALKVQCGDTVMLTNAREGWSAKPFTVVSWALVPHRDAQGNPALGVDLVMRETAAGVFDWADGEETTVDLSPNTTLPNPFTVVAPANLTLLADATTAWVNPDGNFVPRLKVSWDESGDQMVLSGGFTQIQFKKHADSTWISWSRIEGSLLEDFITDLEAGVAYDVRARFENQRGVVSGWSTVSNYTVSGDLVACDPVSSLAATALSEGIRLTWTLPDLTVDPNTDLLDVELYESSSASAPSGGTTPSFKVGRVNSFTRTGLTAGSARYYWARTSDRSQNKSAWTSSVTATPLAGAGTAAADAATALAAANTAVTTANGKNKMFFQTTAPTNPISGYSLVAGDMWVDTDDDNKLYVWDGSAWTARFTPFPGVNGSGHITGLVRAGATGDFILVANNFQIWNGTSAEVPFEIVSGTVYIKDAFIRYLDVAKLTAGNISVALAITTGSLTTGAGTTNETKIDSNGLRVGQTSGSYAKLAQYASGSAGLLLYNSSSTLKGFFVHHGGDTTLSGAYGGNDQILGFNKVNVSNLAANSTSDPRTTDAPLYTAGGAYIAKSLDVLGTIYNAAGSLSNNGSGRQQLASSSGKSVSVAPQGSESWIFGTDSHLKTLGGDIRKVSSDGWTPALSDGSHAIAFKWDETNFKVKIGVDEFTIF